MRRVTTFALACVLFAPCLVSAEDVRAAIESTNRAFAGELASGDAAAVAQRYTEDAAVIAPGAPVARGRAAIEAFWAGAVAAGLRSVALATSSVDAAGDLAAEEGEATLVDADGVTTKSRYVVVWKRQDGEWKLHRDIWN